MNSISKKSINYHSDKKECPLCKSYANNFRISLRTEPIFKTSFLS